MGGITLPGAAQLSLFEGCVEGKMEHKLFKSLTYKQSKKTWFNPQ